jgi:hypothetical protein
VLSPPSGGRRATQAHLLADRQLIVSSNQVVIFGGIGRFAYVDRFEL